MPCTALFLSIYQGAELEQEKFNKKFQAQASLKKLLHKIHCLHICSCTIVNKLNNKWRSRHRLNFSRNSVAFYFQVRSVWVIITEWGPLLVYHQLHYTILAAPNCSWFWDQPSYTGVSQPDCFRAALWKISNEKLNSENRWTPEKKKRPTKMMVRDHSSSCIGRYIWIWTTLTERLWPIKRGNDLSEACRGEKCQSENGRKYVSDKEKAAPGILEPRWVKIGHWARRQETSRARPLLGISSGEER